MSEYSSGQAPGWYYAQGDPPGTQRYWDGAQWVGGPQAAPGAVASPGGYGQSQYGAGGSASYGSRVVAYLIDGVMFFLIAIVVYIVGIVLTAAVSDTLGVVFLLVGFLGLFAFWIWNFCIRQGSTGQTIGKAQQNIKLVADSTGQPVGGGMAFVRYLVAGLISSVTCGIVGLLDILWPLWDDQGKRLTDKMLNMNVVNA